MERKCLEAKSLSPLVLQRPKYATKTCFSDFYHKFLKSHIFQTAKLGFLLVFLIFKRSKKFSQLTSETKLKLASDKLAFSGTKKLFDVVRFGLKLHQLQRQSSMMR